MTDVTQTQQPAEPAVSELEANMAEFFGHRLSDPMEPEATPEPVAEPTPTVPAAMPAAVELNPSSTPAPNAEPAASTNEGDEPEVDAGLMQDVMLGNAPVPTPAPKEAAPAASDPPSSGEQLYMPIKAETIRIPQAQLDSIFRSEDPVEQERALTNLMAGWMNAGIAMMDQRMKEHYVPQISQQAQQSTASAQAAAQVESDFYSSYPDLKAAPQLVQRVGAYYSKMDPNAKWGPDLKAKIGDNARLLAARMGIKLEGAPVKPTPAATPFVADSARPNSALPTGQTDYSPGAMVDELSLFA